MIDPSPSRRRTWTLRAVIAAILVGGIVTATFILAGGNGLPGRLGSASSDKPLFGSSDSAENAANDVRGAVGGIGANEVTVSVNGDMLWHENVFGSGQKPDGTWDFTPLFEHMKPILDETDLNICHAEVPFAAPEGPFLGYPQFQAPPQIAPSLKKMGWEVCTTASNHSVDHGFEGLKRTHDVFRDAGITTVGTYTTEEESEKPVIVTSNNGVRIGLVTGTYGTNGLPVEHPWSVDMLDTDRMAADAKKAKQAGADIVMAVMHAGTEYQQQPNTQQLEAAQALTASPDIDVVYGHHAHVVQPIEKVNGKWVVYGLGNLVASQMPDQYLTYEGLTVQFTFDKGADGWGVKQLKWIPTTISSGGMPVQVAPTTWLMENPGAWGPRTPTQEQLQATIDRTRAIVESRGAGGDPELVEG